MKLHLGKEQREKIKVPELARQILRYLKIVKACSLPRLQQKICPENKVGYVEKDESFSRKFSEAIALLKRRGLLMDEVPMDATFNQLPKVQLTSVGERSNVDDDVLILIDDAQEIINKIKGEIPNLDDVVEQYFLEGLRTCQEGCYIASVICVGAASERAINCLADAVIKHDDSRRKGIEAHRHPISQLTQHLISKFKEYFNPIENRAEIRRQLEGMAMIYRLNRNEAGHPSSLPQDWQRDEQECYLNQFRRYVCTVFKAINILEDGQHNEAEQS